MLLVAHVRETPCRGSCAPLVDHDSENDCAPDDDPLVVLIEVERADGLPYQHDEERSEHGADGAPLSSQQAGAAHAGRGDDVELVARAVTGSGRAIKADARAAGE